MADIVRLDTCSGQVRPVKLYGVLGRKFGRSFNLAVDCAGEAIAALDAQLPGFGKYLLESKDKGLGYAVFYGKRNLSEDELRQFCGADEIRIAPIVLGHKNGGWLQIVLGVVLLFAAAVAGLFQMYPLSAALGQMGWAMIIGGVIQLLTPQPKGVGSQDRPENTPSATFNGPINTQAQGQPVPVVYGRCKVGSKVLSAGITAVDQAIIPTGTAADGGGAGSGGGGGGGAPPWHAEFLES